MYNWAMAVWNMSAEDFVWSFLKWFIVGYIFYVVHNEWILSRTKRWMKLR